MHSGELITINERNYRLDSILSTGVGSYGQVWAATDAKGRAVALKFINAEAMSAADPSLHGHWRAHLQREIDFLERLSASQSRHIVTLIDHGQIDDGQPVLVLERLQANLTQWLLQGRRDGLPPPDLGRILDWVEQILDGLDVIHQAGFVYRDLKFSNILVGKDGALLKLADFGSLKREDGDSTRSCIGTPAMMAPEQIVPIRRIDNGCEYLVDFRADYYALGLLLFTLLSEQSTTEAQRRLGQLLALHGQEGASQHRSELGGLTAEEQELLRRSIEFWTVPVRPEQQQVGAAPLLTDLLMRLLACDPTDRPESSAEIRHVLNAIRADQPAIPLVSLDGLAPPPATPPNRHIRRTHSPIRPVWPKRATSLLGLAGLASALAWATIIQPLFHQQATGPTANNQVVVVPVPKAAPVVSTESAADTTASAKVPPIASEPEPSSPPEPVAKQEQPSKPTSELEVSPTQTETVTAASPAPVPSADSRLIPTIETTTAPRAPAESVTAPIITAPVAKSQPKPPAVTAHSRPTRKTRATGVKPVMPTESSIVSVAPPRQRLAPTVAEQPKSTRTPNKLNAKATTKPAPAVKVTEKSIKTLPAVLAPPVTPPPEPVVKQAPKAPALVKASPKPVESTATAATNSVPLIEKAPISRRTDKTTASTVSERTVSTLKPTAKITGTSRKPPTLPPIELVSSSSTDNTKSMPTPNQPPSTWVGRTNADNPALERIPANTSSRPTAPAMIASASRPRQPVVSTTPPAATRSSDPMSAFQQDTRRTASDIRRGARNFGEWATRTGSSVGTEVQRGLDNANQAIGSWIGTCTNCQTSRPVERRDRWSRYSQGPASR